MQSRRVDIRRLAKAIRDRRLALNLSQEDLAKAAEVSASYVFKLEEERAKNPGADVLLRVADALRYPSIDALLRGDGQLAPARNDDRGEIDKVVAELRRQMLELARSTKQVVLYQWGSAGDPREGSADAVGYQPIPPGRESTVGPRGFAVRVAGNSMARRNIHEGDVVFVNPDRPWGFGSTVLARVRREGEQVMLVKEVALDDQGRTILRSAYLGDEDCQVSGSAYQVIGPVVLRIRIDEMNTGSESEEGQ